MKYFLTVLCGLFCSVQIAYAATMRLVAPEPIYIGEKFSVDVLLDTQGQVVNSVSLDITYPKNVSFVGYSNVQSSIPIWVREPKEVQQGLVTFAGIIPGGIERVYDPNNSNARSIRLTRLYFSTQSKEQFQISGTRAEVLKHDGLGTALEVAIAPLAVSAQYESVPHKTSDVEKENVDSYPPEPFVVAVVPESFFGRTPRLLTFATTDKESGIHHYEVRIGEGSFAIGLSPYPLPYRLFSFTVTVRAFDFSGNMQEQQIVVPGESPLPLGITLLGLLVAMVFYRYIRAKWKNRNESPANTF